MKYFACIDGQDYEVDIAQNGAISLNGEPLTVDIQNLGTPGLYSMLLNNQSREVTVEEKRGSYTIGLAGREFDVKVEDERTRRLNQANRQPTPPSGEIPIKAPIPGLVIKVQVAMGDSVQAGQSLVILEAMKMENELKAPRVGDVSKVNVKPGDRVDQGQVLLILGAGDGENRR